ncbi:MAG: N-acetylneuraminate synthase family protein [Thermodesulfobacteriota bacterium]|nr:N-acetylneuraminate synthase family protein [Thermodesulfobacteriota bacterium]
MLQKKFSIGNFTVSPGGEPYIIAEIGSNHDQSLDKAFKLIEMAGKAGAQAVKFQLFKAEKMYPATTKMYDIFKSIELNADWLPILVERCRNIGVEFMASPFDKESASLLNDIHVSAFKIASSEIVNLGLLTLIASFKKPLIISTGMCDLVDVHDAVECCLRAGNKKVVLLQCGAMYPIPAAHVNLKVMDTFFSLFGCPVGLSDHTSGLTAAIAAVGRGACVIEKHVTMDKKSNGPDHFFAMEPDEFKVFIKMINEAYECLGSRQKKMLPEERIQGRREGLFTARDINEGEVLRESDLIIKRPAAGIRRRHLQSVVGATLKKMLQKGDALEWGELILK